MSFTRDDKENRKFESDPTDSSKVVVKTKIENQASDPVPVSIVNPDSNIDLEVTIQPNITIDDSTPIDVNISNAAVATNATIQGTPSVSVTGDVGIDDATAIRVDVTNAAVATNATIQNSHINVYDKLYNGSAWVNQLSDNDGRAIVLNKKYYSAADITALGSSTSVREWVSAYSDDILEYKYVQTFDDEHPKIVYYTHPDLGDSNKCLKILYVYTTQNSVKVVQSVTLSVVDWTFDSAVTGTVTLTLGTITSPNPSSAIAVGTDICTVAAAASGGGAITLTLSGTNASLYTLRNVTDGTTGASLAYDAAKSFVLETASDFSGSSYSHSVTITATEATFGLTTSSNVATSGTFVAAPSWANAYYANMPGDTVKDAGWELSSTGSELSLWPSLGNGTNYFPEREEAWTLSFWIKGAHSGAGSYVGMFGMYTGGATPGADAQIKIYRTGSQVWITLFRDSLGGRTQMNFTDGALFDDNWNQFTLAKDTSGVTGSAFSLYINGSSQSLNVAVNTFGNSTGFNGDSIGHVHLAGAPYGASSGNFLTKYNYTFAMDELVCFKRELLTNNSGVNEITELYNSGTPKDPSTLSFASEVDSYFRFGDGDNDSVAGNTFVDEEDSARTFSKGYAGSQALTAY